MVESRYLIGEYNSVDEKPGLECCQIFSRRTEGENLGSMNPERLSVSTLKILK
jgi:hypothetical protein